MMETAGTQGQPVGDMAEVLQEPERPELGLPVSVPVSVDGPVQTHMVPSVSAGSKTWLVSATLAQRVANADPRRRVVRLIGVGGAFRVGATQNEVSNTMTSVLWPAGVPMELTHADSVYVMASTTDVTVSALVENWAS